MIVIELLLAERHHIHPLRRLRGERTLRITVARSAQLGQSHSATPLLPTLAARLTLQLRPPVAASLCCACCMRTCGRVEGALHLGTVMGRSNPLAMMTDLHQPGAIAVLRHGKIGQVSPNRRSAKEPGWSVAGAGELVIPQHGVDAPQPVSGW